MTVQTSQSFSNQIRNYDYDQIQKVQYSRSATNIVPNPYTDNSSSGGFSTNVTAVGPESQTPTTLTSDVYLTSVSAIACTDTSEITIPLTTFDPWWQVIDSDVASNGSLTSDVPAGNYFGLPGGGGYPGVSSYSTSTNLTNTTASQIGWLTQSSGSSTKIFGYDYFSKQIPSSIVPTQLASSSITGANFNSSPQSDGYEWYKYTGPTDLSIDGNIDLGGDRVILLIENANLNINGRINLADGQGFFVVIVEGNININPGVGGSAADLEGIYLADGAVLTGTTGLANDAALHVRGSIAAYGGITMQRDLGTSNGTTPAELFEYAPDQILLFPTKLGYRRINWKEVAP